MAKVVKVARRLTSLEKRRTSRYYGSSKGASTSPNYSLKLEWADGIDLGDIIDGRDAGAACLIWKDGARELGLV